MHGDDDAVLRVEACGLCGTDHEQYTGHLAGGFAFVPGHETVGVLESIGDIAAERWGVATGDRVAVEVFQSCRVCDACRAGSYQRCERHGLTDMYGYIPVDKPPGLWGGYAECQYLGPDTIVHRIPDALDPVVATLFNPVGAGVRWAVTLPGTRPGDVVAVLGPGVRGLSAAPEERSSWPGPAAVRCPSSSPTTSCSRSSGSSVRSASTRPRTAPHSRCSRQVGTRSPIYPGASPRSTMPRSSFDRSPARVMRRHRFTA